MLKIGHIWMSKHVQDQVLFDITRLYAIIFASLFVIFNLQKYIPFIKQIFKLFENKFPILLNPQINIKKN